MINNESFFVDYANSDQIRNIIQKSEQKHKYLQEISNFIKVENPKWIDLTGFHSDALVDIITVALEYINSTQNSFSPIITIFMSIHFLKNHPSFASGCLMFNIKSPKTYKTGIINGIKALSSSFNSFMFLDKTGLPSLKAIFEGKPINPSYLLFCHFVIDGKHQAIKRPSYILSYLPTEFFSFKLSHESYNTLYIIDLNGFIRFISKAYPASKNDSYIYKNERENILQNLSSILQFSRSEDKIFILADGGFPTSECPEIIKKNIQSSEKFTYNVLQKSRNKIEQVFGREANTLPSTHQRYDFHNEYYDEFQRASAFLTNHHIFRNPISKKFQELFLKEHLED